MKVIDLLKILREEGWIEIAQKGSHRHFTHPSKNGKVTVPIHHGDIPVGTLRSILRQAGIEGKI